jgi:hypothetical protein
LPPPSLHDLDQLIQPYRSPPSSQSNDEPA